MNSSKPVTEHLLTVCITSVSYTHLDVYKRQVMRDMNRAGIGFYLDDFGTGYSNLSSVLEFPFECVKLDKSLLKEFPGNPDAEMMVRTCLLYTSRCRKHLPEI